MKRIYTAAASVALIIFSVPSGQAASKAKDESPTVQARAMLAEVESLSNSVAETADRLSMRAKNQGDSQSEVFAIKDIRDDVNRIGRDLRVLESEQAELDKWESGAVDEIMPLMQEVAANTEKAIQIFQTDRNHLWATAFPAETAKVYEDAERVKELLDGHLKLAKVREQEQRIESTVDANQ